MGAGLQEVSMLRRIGTVLLVVWTVAIAVAAVALTDGEVNGAITAGKAWMGFK